MYNGSPFAATAFVVGTDGTPGASLEGVNPGLTYYAGSTAAGPPLGGPPTAVGTYTVVAAFPGSADYAPATAQATFTVTQATATVGTSDAGGVYNGSPFAATASVVGTDGTPGASLEGVNPILTYYAGSTAAGTPLGGPPAAVGTYTVVATFPGSTDYAPATAQATFTVTQATPAIAWNAPGTLVYGTALSSGQLDASANLPGTLSYTPAAGTILGAGSDTLSVTFTPSDTLDYTTATAQTTITVTPATPAIAWDAPGPIVYGTALSSGQLDASRQPAGDLRVYPRRRYHPQRLAATRSP